MKVGDVISTVNTPFGYIEALTDDYILVDIGDDLIHLKSDEVIELFSLGDLVFIRDTDHSFIIKDFYWSDSNESWMAIPAHDEAISFSVYEIERPELFEPEDEEF